ncbi:hypothetical protein CKY04_05145 [Photorhabdus sp. S8-52]|nr:hypothetical protein CKY04_05145 [Photorhabdus sp. S8-52]
MRLNLFHLSMKKMFHRTLNIDISASIGKHTHLGKVGEWQVSYWFTKSVKPKIDKKRWQKKCE